MLKCINHPLSVTWQNNLVVANACFHVLGFCWFFTVPEAEAYVVCGRELSDSIMKANVVTKFPSFSIPACWLVCCLLAANKRMRNSKSEVVQSLYEAVFLHLQAEQPALVWVSKMLLQSSSTTFIQMLWMDWLSFSVISFTLQNEVNCIEEQWVSCCGLLPKEPQCVSPFVLWLVLAFGKLILCSLFSGPRDN